MSIIALCPYIYFSAEAPKKFMVSLYHPFYYSNQHYDKANNRIFFLEQHSTTRNRSKKLVEWKILLCCDFHVVHIRNLSRPQFIYFWVVSFPELLIMPVFSLPYLFLLQVVCFLRSFLFQATCGSALVHNFGAQLSSHDIHTSLISLLCTSFYWLTGTKKNPKKSTEEKIHQNNIEGKRKEEIAFLDTKIVLIVVMTIPFISSLNIYGEHSCRLFPTKK